MPCLLELTNKTFGRLTPISRVGKKGNHTMWRCLCTCGKYIETSTNRLTQGKTRSCGCLRKDVVRSVSYRHGNYAKGSKISPERRVFYQVKSRAKQNSIEFTLDLRDIVIPDRCPVLGIKINKNRNLIGDDSPSLDRLDPKKGYTKENTRIISFRANRMKQNASLEELQKLVAWVKAEQERLI